MKKRESTMSHPSLSAVGNHRCRCNTSDSRYKRESRYAISCIGLKISYVHKLQDTHNVSYLTSMYGENEISPNAKLAKIIKKRLITVLITVLIKHNPKSRSLIEH